MNSFISFLTGLFILFADTSDIPYLAIEKAMKANDAKTIVQLANEPVQLNILGKEGAYNHSQAEMILDQFFTKNPKGDFVFVFKGKETSDGTFAIGKYTLKKDSLRLSFHFREIKSLSKLESLTIEKE
jgi:hypothetical protein